MLRCILAVIVVMLTSVVSKAGLVMTLSPSSSTVTSGGIIDFTIFIESSVAVSVGGIDLMLLAGAGDGTHGNFVSPFSIFLASPLPPLEDWDVSGPGQAFYARNVILSPPASPNGVSLAANNMVPFATIKLDTAGVAPGTFLVDFDNASFTALNQVNANIPMSGVGASVTVTAIPEPNSLVLLTAVACGYILRRRRRTPNGLGQLGAQ